MPKKDFPIEQTKEEPFKKPTEQDIERIKKLLLKKNDNFSPPYILKTLNEKDSLRKVFLSVLKNSPAKISDITEDTLMHKQNCYPILSQLVGINLLKRIFVMDIINGKEKNDQIMEKFNLWTKHMPENTRRYYSSKTSYWEISEFGKQFVVRAYDFEQKYREKKNE